MFRRLGAFAAIVAMVVVPPVLLVLLGSYDVAGLSLWTPADVRLVLLVLTAVGWVAWAAWIASLAVELAALLAPGRRPTRLPGLALPQALAGWLVAAMVASAGAAGLTSITASPLVNSTTERAEAAAPGPDTTASDSKDRAVEAWSAARAEDRHAEADADTSAGEARARRAKDPETVVVAQALAVTSRTVRHVVGPGDDLWTIAQRYYGEGTAWRQVVAANPTLQQDPLAELREGTELSIVDPVKLVTVRPGDTLSRLAQQHLGDAGRWPEIRSLNRARIADPDLIQVGWVLRVPLVVPATAQPYVGVPTSATGGGPAPDAPSTAARHAGSSATAASGDTRSPGLRDTQGATKAAPEASPDDGSARPGAGIDGETAIPRGPTQTGERADAASNGGIATTPVTSPVEESPEESDAPAIAALVGGLSALTAGAVLGGIAVRRRLQAAARPLGRRYVQPSEELRTVETALAVRASEHEPDAPILDREDLVGRAMRHLSKTWCEAGVAAPPLAKVVVGDVDVEFEFATDPGPTPDGFQVIGTRVAASWIRLSDLDDPPFPAAYPALVTLGEEQSGELVMVDLLSTGVLGVTGQAEAAASALSAMMVELTCAPWAAELGLLVVSEAPSFALAAAVDTVGVTASVTEGVERLERLASERGRFLAASGAYDRSRLDPNLAEAWSPQIVLFESIPDADALARIEAAVSATRCGLAAVVPSEAPRWSWTLSDPGATSIEGVLTASDAAAPRRVLAAQTIPRPAREAIAGLYTLAQATTSEPAPWWTRERGTTELEESDAVNIIALQPAVSTTGPLLRMLGPIVLERTTGDEPPRAARQCMEYCGWLLEHPGATATHMAGSLLVAEGTRRSNMSRLRTWLGSDAAGHLYLPDAYSGRIYLHEAVTSDFDAVRRLLVGGVDRASTERLTAVLDLVRGAPLADAAPGQWHWAEELRSDMVSLIRDVGVVLSARARQERNFDVSRWAANRALSAAPEDELLLCERIRTEYAAGALDEVERLAARIHRTARALGIDLFPETVDLLQEVMEGRIRARRA